MTTIHMTGHSAKTAPFSDRVEARPIGRLPYRDRDDEADDQAGERRLPGGPPHRPEQHQHHRDRQSRNEERQRQAVADRRQKLTEHVVPSMAAHFAQAGALFLVNGEPACEARRPQSISTARRLPHRDRDGRIIGGEILDIRVGQILDHDRHQVVRASALPEAP